jgi:hypothetical protein
MGSAVLSLAWHGIGVKARNRPALMNNPIASKGNPMESTGSLNRFRVSHTLCLRRAAGKSLASKALPGVSAEALAA